jgi:hypothetical protein
MIVLTFIACLAGQCEQQSQAWRQADAMLKARGDG